ncbi:unnamed protein product, partial [Iphiclides podalirius]
MRLHVVPDTIQKGGKGESLVGGTFISVKENKAEAAARLFIWRRVTQYFRSTDGGERDGGGLINIPCPLGLF